MSAVEAARKNCPALQGDEPRRGGGGLTPTGRNAPSVRRAAAIMAVLFAMRGRNDPFVCHAE